MLDEHPSITRWRARATPASARLPLSAERLRALVLQAGADDVGFVELERPGLEQERAAVLEAFPEARTLIAFVLGTNRANLRSPQRSAANLEFHHATDALTEIARRVVAALHAQGVAGFYPSAGFPMEMERFPGRTWLIAHKPVAEAAGLGRMGLHRNVIHPRLGSFVLLGTLAIDADVDVPSQPIAYNPCVDCKLCVAACPVGAIAPDGHFDVSACYTHNYREFMSGFGAWAEQVADSRDARDYRRRVSDSESASLWQSLSYGANYKAAYCIAVCPAGDDVIGPFLEQRPGFLQRVLRPLQEKREVVYVVPGSDAEQYVRRRFPHKTPRRVSNGLRAANLDGFVRGLPLRFQRGRAADLRARYHFKFTGADTRELTVVIDAGRLDVQAGHVGQADLRVTVDARTWLALLRRDVSLLRALLTRRLRLAGPARLLRAFGRCFPS
jgi:Fe-S-cluster-containing hydrogenase component 2